MFSTPVCLDILCILLLTRVSRWVGRDQPNVATINHINHSTASWWLNQPYWKFARPIGSSPQVGGENTNNWNHHLDSINEVESHIHSDSPKMVIRVILAIHIQGDTRHSSSERWVILGGWVPKDFWILLVKLAYPGEFMEKAGLNWL